MSKVSQIELQYRFNYNSVPINLDIWESEMYYAAIPVQQMVGNLIYYSNYGRYELRLAKSWEKITDNLWKIRLQEGAQCENGEKITAEGFVKSITRSLFIMSKHGDTPVLKNLSGYDEFILANKGKSIFELSSIKGLKSDGDQIVFDFNKSVRDGLLQILSFAPYGYICSENLNKDGTWKDSKKFISSGPYKLKKYENENYISLKKNPSWIMPFKEKSPDVIHFHQGNEKQTDFQNGAKVHPLIIDSFTNLKNIQEGLIKYEVVQEYFKGVVLGNFNQGIFGNLENRRKFRRKFFEFKKDIAKDFPEIKYTEKIYPTQDLDIFKESDNNDKAEGLIKSSNTTVSISGVEPKAGSRNWPPWLALKKTLDYFSIKYKFSNSSYSRSDFTDGNYDLRLIGPSVGGGVEPWVIEVMFCSKLNASFPDPRGKVCGLISDYGNNKIDGPDLAKLFFETVDYDSAILPFSHYGVQLYLSKHINVDSISPALSVMRLDQLEIEHE